MIALAIESLGHVVGTASSATGFFTTVVGALLGYRIGQQFNDSVVPLTLGYVMLGLGASGIVSLVESGENDATSPAPCCEKR